jgi:Domain of unknown function (DUF397)
MTDADDRADAAEPVQARWRKSRRSNSQGACVELAPLADGGVAIRNSRFPGGPVLRYTQAEFHALVEGIKAGDFDHLLRQPARSA